MEAIAAAEFGYWPSARLLNSFLDDHKNWEIQHSAQA